jgi:hypothetical protein
LQYPQRNELGLPTALKPIQGLLVGRLPIFFEIGCLRSSYGFLGVVTLATIKTGWRTLDMAKLHTPDVTAKPEPSK